MSSIGFNKKNFISGLIWNYGSMILLAVGGLLFNLLIVIFYNSEVLGVFNQVYAYYIVISQFAVFGIHLAVLKYLSYICDDNRYKIITSGLILSVVSSIIVVSIGTIIMVYLEFNTMVFDGLKVILPTMILFSFNKVLFSILNAYSKMKAYACFQSIRIIGIIAGISILYGLHVNPRYISSCITIGEIIVTIPLVIYFIKKRLIVYRFSLKWTYKLLSFGIRAMPSNLIVELNSKIDILCLSFLLNDNSLIGIYSFAVFFSEGFYQIFIVIRRNVNPYIARMYMDNYIEERLINKYNKQKLTVASFLISLLILFAVYLISLIIGNEYLNGLKPLGIILLSIVLSSYYVVLGNTMSQIGKPLIESYVNTITVLTNLSLNVLLIPRWDIVGAGMGTAVSILVYRTLMKYCVKKYYVELITGVKYEG